jgi:ethanolaminephosphotransferase
MASKHHYQSFLDRQLHDLWRYHARSQHRLEVSANPFFLSSPIQLTNLPSAQNVQKARRERGQRARKALLGLLSFFAVWILVPIYLALNPLILSQHLIPFVFFVGIINAYSVGQIIVAHLTKSRFPYYNVLILPLLFGVLDSIGPVLQRRVGFGWPSALGHDVYQVSYMFLCLGLAIGVYGSFVVDVIYTICDYLDIWCLTIKHPYVPDTNGSAKKAQ